ncbi:MAG TPA: hypothetical protein VGC64_02710, partial [Pyrinomonadaceae bacterium]
MCQTKSQIRSAFLFVIGHLCLLGCMTVAARAQETKPTPTPAPVSAPTPAPSVSAQAAVIVVKAKYNSSGTAPVARKHFYLSTKPFPALAALLQNAGPPPSYKLYQRALKESGKFADETVVAEFVKNWLEKYRCETVYCRPIEMKDVESIHIFKDAYQKALGVFAKSPNSSAEALKWMTNFLPAEIRSGYYEMQTEWLKKALAFIQRETKVPVQTVMTNRNGLAYFTRLAQGEYYVSNLLPIETEDGCFLWNTQKGAKVKVSTDVVFTDKKK